VTTVTAFLSRLTHRSITHPASWGSSATHDLAQRIDLEGIEAVSETELAAVARAGRAAGAPDTVLDVLVDRHEPRPARERAFGHVTAHLVQSRGVGFHLAA
jgi:hypothetical protein